MKSLKSFILVALCALLLGAPALGQTNPGPSTSAPNAQHRGGMMSMLRKLDLSTQQQDQIKALIQAFEQAHAQGTKPDPAELQQLHEQILAVLTPAQRTQLEQEEQQWRADHPDDGHGPTPSPSPSS